MSFLTMFLNQTATLWVLTGTNEFGEPSFAAPVPIPCRWEDRTSYIQDAEGNQVPSRSRVFLDRAVKTGDWMMLGTSAVADPQSVDSAYRVMDFRKVPSLDAQDFELMALL
jgi:hypothetical protein